MSKIRVRNNISPQQLKTIITGNVNLTALVIFFYLNVFPNLIVSEDDSYFYEDLKASHVKQAGKPIGIFRSNKRYP